MNVGALIGILISIVVGVSLLSAIMDSVEQVEASAEIPTGLKRLLDILPIIFVAVIILGAVAWIGGIDGGSKQKEIRIKIQRNSKSLINRLQRASLDLSIYINNLDTILGIKTVAVRSNKYCDGIYLNKENNELEICFDTAKGGVWDWYLVDRNIDATMFKVVGLHKEDANKNVVYALGNNKEKPFLIKVPNEHIEEKTRQEWTELVKVQLK